MQLELPSNKLLLSLVLNEQCFEIPESLPPQYTFPGAENPTVGFSDESSYLRYDSVELRLVPLGDDKIGKDIETTSDLHPLLLLSLPIEFSQDVSCKVCFVNMNIYIFIKGWLFPYSSCLQEILIYLDPFITQIKGLVLLPMRKQLNLPVAGQPFSRSSSNSCVSAKTTAVTEVRKHLLLFFHHRSAADEFVMLYNNTQIPSYRCLLIYFPFYSITGPLKSALFLAHHVEQ